MKKVFIVAGGTGGHINAALAVGDYFIEKGEEVHYYSGKRYLDFKLFSEETTTFLDSYPLRGRGPYQFIKSVFKNLKVLTSLYFEFKKKKPSLLIGAGGYVCGPTLLAAKLNFIPIFIIEQNAVMGFTNRLLSLLSTRIFVHFRKTLKLSHFLSKKVIVSGNPVRSSILPESEESKTSSGVKNILVFGGSLGAKQINDIIFNLLREENFSHFHIIHQVGKNNLKEVKLQNNTIKYEQFEYLEDIGSYYDWSDVVISRAGASTISELRIVGKPAILIPYPKATDNHQYFNALELQNENLFPMIIIDYRKEIKDILPEIKEFLKMIKEKNININIKAINLTPSEVIYNEALSLWK